MSLSVRKISIQAGSQTLLDQVSMELQPGVLTMVIGPNGSGKTTLLRALAGELSPARGEVRLEHRPLSLWKPLHLARLRSVLPQTDSLSFPFRAEEVVIMGRSPWREALSRSAAIAGETLALMDARHLAQRTYTTLSGGEKQRVQLARVLAQIWSEQHDTPRYLLLDEPVSALDLGHQYSLLNRIKRQTREHGSGALVTLHDLNLAAQFADRLILLDQGGVAADGTPQTVLQASLIERVYGLPVQVAAHPVYPEIPMVTPLFRDAPFASRT